MPIYEYRCIDCDSEFELLVMGQQDPACPSCRATTIEKLLSVPSAPSVKSGSLPISPSESCQQPRCCGGFCQE